jgi:hypothetical protein
MANTHTALSVRISVDAPDILLHNIQGYRLGRLTSFIDVASTDGSQPLLPMTNYYAASR